MKTRVTASKLKERMKELQCLYELSRIAMVVDTRDLKAFISKTLTVLPKAMQYPRLAEAMVSVSSQVYTTSKFGKSKHRISEALTVDEKKCGKVEIGYTTIARDKRLQKKFLAEEKDLLKAAAHMLSLFIKRNAIENERQKLQLQLQHSERLAFVGELSSGIAHELNEPLGRILGFAQLIKKTGGLSHQQNEDIEKIIKGSLYTREIIKKLMLFSRQMPSQFSMVNLNEVISNIMYFIDIRFQNQKIVIHKKLDARLPNIQADAVQMSQVFVNLITNAIQAMSSGGELIITTKKKKGLVSFSVKDTGHGMPAEIRDKVFEPFFTTKPIGQGTGLGLSVVQGIITAHHGKISLTSKPGKGSVFEILLPFKQPNAN